MPLHCNGLHDYSEPYYERVRFPNATKFPLTRMHLVQKCSQCGEVREVYDQHLVSRGDRIKSYPVEQE